MITQKEIQDYINVRKQYEELEGQFKGAKEKLIDRMKGNEAVEAGGLGLNLKLFDKVTTSYKEVLNSIKTAIETLKAPKVKEELLNTMASALNEFSKTTPQSRLDAVANEVVTVVKSKKVA